MTTTGNGRSGSSPAWASKWPATRSKPRSARSTSARGASPSRPRPGSWASRARRPSRLLAEAEESRNGPSPRRSRARPRACRLSSALSRRPSCTRPPPARRSASHIRGPRSGTRYRRPISQSSGKSARSTWGRLRCRRRDFWARPGRPATSRPRCAPSARAHPLRRASSHRAKRRCGRLAKARPRPHPPFSASSGRAGRSGTSRPRQTSLVSRRPSAPLR